MKESLYIIAGVRTPFCRMGTTLASVDAIDLGRTVVAAVLANSTFDPAQIDEVIFGRVGQPPDAPNVSRATVIRAGVPESVPAVMVHRNCASGFEALTHAAEKISSGHGDIFLVGGAERMTYFPLLYSEGTASKFTQLPKARNLAQKVADLLRFLLGDFKPRSSLQLALVDPVYDQT